MIGLILVMAGVVAGALTTYLVMERMRRARERVPTLKSVNWERAVVRVVTPALKHLRRHYPTHELVTGFPFMDLVNARGAASESIRRRCEAWTVGIVMVDRRNDVVSRIVVWDCDADGQEKTWILRRAGYKVTTMPREVDEGGIVAAMAA